MDDVVKEFLIESYENLDRLDGALVELEKNPRHKESLDSIFRTIHTIKGTCGFIGFGKLQKLTHVGESLLSRLREGALILNAQITSALLAMVDVVRKILAHIEQTGDEGAGEYPELIESLTQLAAGEKAGNGSATNSAVKPPPASPAIKISAPPTTVVASAPPPPPQAPLEVEKVAVPSNPADRGSAPREQDRSADVTPPSPAPAPPSAPAPASPGNEPRAHGISETTIRVDVGLLDKLMNLVGELVLARNQIIQHTANAHETSLLAASQRLSLITTELQESVMKTRMQPIGNVWVKLPRVVRDVSSELGKKIRIEMDGNETELDRTILEAIKDPLTHIVRNSIDHGIESPAERRASGKPEEGLLRMRAFHEGGQVNIEISDDGAGINLAKVRKKALERNLLTPEQEARLTDREALNLIFLPALSTAEKVTNVSGRGVGMDVVKTNIEKIGGSVDLQSEAGRGTTLKIKIPLTLAIIPALIVTCGGARYAIPQVSLVELVRLEGEEARTRIENVFGAPACRLRGKLLPLVYLRRELKLEDSSASRLESASTTGSRLSGQTGPASPSTAYSTVNIIVLQAGDHRFGLVVDQVNDTQEIVVKPLVKQLKKLRVFAGATIMGDGTVALILDVLGIAQGARLISEMNDRRRSDLEKQDQTQTASQRQTLLIVRAGDHERMAVPLDLVGRLEQFPRSQAETVGQMHVIQYRGQILPLLNISDILNCPSTDVEEGPMRVVVYTKHGRSVGLVVSSILDIVEDAIELDRRQCRSGFLGTAIIQGRVTPLLDVPALVAGVDGSLAE